MTAHTAPWSRHATVHDNVPLWLPRSMHACLSKATKATAFLNHAVMPFPVSAVIHPSPRHLRQPASTKRGRAANRLSIDRIRSA